LLDLLQLNFVGEEGVGRRHLADLRGVIGLLLEVLAVDLILDGLYFLMRLEVFHSFQTILLSVCINFLSFTLLADVIFCLGRLQGTIF